MTPGTAESEQDEAVKHSRCSTVQTGWEKRKKQTLESRAHSFASRADCKLSLLLIKTVWTLKNVLCRMQTQNIHTVQIAIQ